MRRPPERRPRLLARVPVVKGSGVQPGSGANRVAGTNKSPRLVGQIHVNQGMHNKDLKDVSPVVEAIRYFRFHRAYIPFPNDDREFKVVKEAVRNACKTETGT